MAEISPDVAAATILAKGATVEATPKKDDASTDASASATIDSIPDKISPDAVPKVVYSSSKKRPASAYRLVPRLSIAYVRCILTNGEYMIAHNRAIA